MHLHKRPIAAIGSVALLGLSSPASAGATHTWTGVASSEYQNAANWNTGAVPGGGDSIIILDGPQLGVTLSQDTAVLQSVYIGGGMWLSSFGHRILVSGSIGSTKVIQPNSILQIMPEGPDGNGHAIDTDTLTLELGAELRMAGGVARVDETMHVTGSSVITGHGVIEIGSAQDAALAASGGRIAVDGGTLRFLMTGGGSMSVPSDIEIFGEGNRLRLNGPLYAPLYEVAMGDGGRLTIGQDWSIYGTLSAENPGTATVDGTGRADFDGTVSASAFARLLLNGEVDFNDGGELLIDSYGTVELHDLWSVATGHQTSIGFASRLLIGGDSHTVWGWNGDIEMDGGFLEVNEAIVINGDLEMRSGMLGTRPTLLGSAPVALANVVTIPATVATFEADWDATDDASISVNAGSTVEVAGTGRIHGGASVGGPGRYRIMPTGTLTASFGVIVGSDVRNDGRLEPGWPTGDLGINGDYEQVGAGTLEIEIAGAALGQVDRVDVADTAELAGTLEVHLLGGYQPDLGEPFIVLTADSVLGAFDEVVGPAGMQVEYFPSQVVVTFEETCAADVDGDGAAGFTDLLAILADWGPCPGCASDVDGDGVVDFADLIALLAAWGEC